MYCFKFLANAFITSGDSEIAAMVIRESEQEGNEARTFLEDVRVTFPQVCKRELMTCIAQ